jgi:phosphatidylserine/phosphatidylglycerophosphate/cardiolipin synthase-like enzyme
MPTLLTLLILSVGDGGVADAGALSLGPCSTKQIICFSPLGKCDLQLVALIDKATKTLEVAIFSINRVGVVDALIRAKQRGVTVRMVVDTTQISQDKETDQLVRLLLAGIPIKRDTHNGYMHSKVVVVDDTWLATGSFNFTNNASDNNNENMLIWSCPRNALLYRQEFERLWLTFKDATEQVRKLAVDAGI